MGSKLGGVLRPFPAEFSPTRQVERLDLGDLSAIRIFRQLLPTKTNFIIFIDLPPTRFAIRSQSKWRR